MTVFNLKNFHFENNNVFLLDTNILIYLHGPMAGKYFKSKEYKGSQEIVENILINKCKIYIDITVLTEFINRYIQIALKDKLNNKKIAFKKSIHRNTNEYNEILLELQLAIKNIKQSYSLELINSNYNFLEDLVNIDFCNKFNKMEFNDYAISRICSNGKNMILVTNDKDFLSCDDLDILKLV